MEPICIKNNREYSFAIQQNQVGTVPKDFPSSLVLIISVEPTGRKKLKKKGPLHFSLGKYITNKAQLHLHFYVHMTMVGNTKVFKSTHP